MFLLFTSFKIIDVKTEVIMEKKIPSEKEILINKFNCNEEIAEYVIKYSAINNLDPKLVLSLIKAESNFDPKAINYNSNESIDRGLMQLNSSSFMEMSPKEFYDIETNISLGCEYLRWCLDKSDENLILGLTYYNNGYKKTKKSIVSERTLCYINKILIEMK
jgi:soluble lytic murein transglycosylase-like protein